MDTELTHEEKELIERHKTCLLQIELVPKSSWCSNVRSVLKQSQWDKIRKSTYNKAGDKCEICKSTGKRHPDCHEVWAYDSSSMTQRLAFFQAICPACHEVKHLGRAIARGNGNVAFNRFREFNSLDELLALRIRDAVFKEWRERSKVKWALDITLLKDYDINVKEIQSKNMNAQRNIAILK